MTTAKGKQKVQNVVWRRPGCSPKDLSAITIIAPIKWCRNLQEILNYNQVQQRKCPYLNNLWSNDCLTKFVTVLGSTSFAFNNVNIQKAYCCTKKVNKQFWWSHCIHTIKKQYPMFKLHFKYIYSNVYIFIYIHIFNFLSCSVWLTRWDMVDICAQWCEQ